nr:GNAT family N-acetyltransferase [uncultured Actinoplanes sp.]
MTLHIRPGGTADVPAVLRLLDGAVDWLVAHGRPGQWGTTPMSAVPRRVAMTETMAANGELHVATLGDDVVGAIGVGTAPDYVPAAREPELYVTLLVTDRAHAGSDIGGRLLDHARGLARTAGVGLLRVDCYAGVDQALVRYYERQGFTATESFVVNLPAMVWPGRILQERLT